MAIDQKKLEAWVDYFGFEKRGALIGEKTLHASGHMDRKGLKDLIETINPRFVIPIHTENPEAFSEITPREKLILPAQGIPLEF
ncbi:MAG: MBL fold metallo-hydrolase RNA specificity domain-containing protein [Coprothermobacterota bacterium]|nr:MBL fold metallo-hydrolase RNA specificity domain-containing protein [Coprothermobacterota bacterium]